MRTVCKVESLRKSVNEEYRCRRVFVDIVLTVEKIEIEIFNGDHILSSTT